MFDVSPDLQTPLPRPTEGVELTELVTDGISLVYAGANMSDAHILKSLQGRHKMATKPVKKMDELFGLALSAAEQLIGSLPEQMAGVPEGDGAALAELFRSVAGKFEKFANFAADSASAPEAPEEPEMPADMAAEFEMAKGTLKALEGRLAAIEQRTDAVEKTNSELFDLTKSIDDLSNQNQQAAAELFALIQSMKGGN